MRKYVILFLILPVFVYGKDFRGAELRTKSSYIYGRFEVNYKASYGAGQTATFFTYHELGSGGISEWNELDIEILGRYTDDVQFNPITPGQANHEHHQWVNFDPTADFHTYAIEWTPDYVAWFVEGEEVHRQTGDHITALNRDQKIMMNIWPPAYSSWVGTLDTRMLPFFAYYDWVSYASYTPDSGNVGTENNFTFQWRDDFESWDTDRWAKASHTWNGNNSDFIPDNCVFMDGKMILCLTDAINTGYTDKNKPFVEYARYQNDTVLVAFSEEITRESAEKVGNYMISGLTVVKAIQQRNHRHVKLIVEGLDENSSHSLVVLGIKDLAAPANTLLGQSVPIQTPPRWQYPLKINVGGDAYGDWLADQNWTHEGDYGQIGGTPGSYYGQPVSGTTDDLVFQTEQRGIVKYQVRLPAGKYTVSLMLAENYFNAPDCRLMDINVEGEYVVRDLDLFAAAGAHAAFYLEVSEVCVSDGILDIHLADNKDFTLLNGIIINQYGSKTGQSETGIPARFYLSQNYPNPFNPATTIEYRIMSPADITIKIFDLLGNEIACVVDNYLNPGSYIARWQAGDMAGGLYFYRMDASNAGQSFSETRKMILVK